ncbi:LysR substrate-binding domain-containing protein [Celeribacter sp.]|uniref:LysR substrate-binding domain-containing protein n=1 Tax=Celeribacter sp. TaxID=1890673 RepID=UPI003A8F203E
MNSRQIEAFRAVIRLGSMTNAGDMLGISQPAVSRLIRDLETYLGLKLFRREGNRLIATHESLVLFEEVDLHYRGFAQIEKVARDLRNQSVGSLRVAAPHSLASFFLADVTARFVSEKPSIGVSIASFHSTLIAERIALRQFDIGLVQLKGDHPGVRVIPLQPPAAVAILSKAHPLAEYDILTPDLMAGQNFISLGQNSPLRARIDTLFSERGIERAQQVEADLAATVCGFVSRAVGLSIVDPFAASAMAKQEVVVRAFQPTIPFEVAVLIPANRNLSSHAQRYLDLIKIHFRAG